MRQELRSLVTIKREHLMDLRFNLALFDHPNEIHKVPRAIGFDGEPHLEGAQRVQEAAMISRNPKFSGRRHPF